MFAATEGLSRKFPLGISTRRPKHSRESGGISDGGYSGSEEASDERQSSKKIRVEKSSDPRENAEELASSLTRREKEELQEIISDKDLKKQRQDSVKSDIEEKFVRKKEEESKMKAPIKKLTNLLKANGVTEPPKDSSRELSDEDSDESFETEKSDKKKKKKKSSSRVEGERQRISRGRGKRRLETLVLSREEQIT